MGWKRRFETYLDWIFDPDKPCTGPAKCRDKRKTVNRRSFDFITVRAHAGRLVMNCRRGFGHLEITPELISELQNRWGRILRRSYPLPRWFNTMQMLPYLWSMMIVMKMMLTYPYFESVWNWDWDGRSIIGEKREYEHRHGVADALYQSVKQSHHSKMW